MQQHNTTARLPCAVVASRGRFAIHRPLFIGRLIRPLKRKFVQSSLDITKDVPGDDRLLVCTARKREKRRDPLRANPSKKGLGALPTHVGAPFVGDVENGNRPAALPLTVRCPRNPAVFSVIPGDCAPTACGKVPGFAVPAIGRSSSSV